MTRKMTSLSAHRARMRDFLHDCVASTGAEQADRLHEAALLLGVAPEQQPAIAAMIACGAYESAAFLVVGQDRPFLVSRGLTGACLASTVLGNGDEEATAEAATPALAMLAAHMSATLAAGTRLSGSPSLRLH